MPNKHTHDKHHGKTHAKPAERSKNTPIGMTTQRSKLAAFLAFGFLGFVVLAILAVIAYAIFN
jgi:hypothetical protein